jgi:hypothetical protein
MTLPAVDQGRSLDIGNPAAKLAPREEVSVVGYVVAQRAWRQEAEAGDRAT